MLFKKQTGNFRIVSWLQYTMVISGLALLTGCEVLNEVKTVATTTTLETTVNKSALCVNKQQKADFDQFCDAEAWLEYMLQVQALTWSERLQEIDELDASTPSLIKKVLLSQGADTPYQHRLRAQNWLVSLNEQGSATLQRLLNGVIFENSKLLLEFESAITILSRVNARQMIIIDELELKILKREQEIEKQQDQVEQLLKIETDLIEQKGR